MGHQVENRHDEKNNPYRMADSVAKGIKAAEELLRGSKSSMAESQFILASATRSNEAFRKDIQTAAEFLQERKRFLDAVKVASFE